MLAPLGLKETETTATQPRGQWVLDVIALYGEVSRKSGPFFAFVGCEGVAKFKILALKVATRDCQPKR